MSVSGISSSSFLDYEGQSVQNNRQQAQQEFQQLGQDLQAGNLSAAQSDFATLQQLVPQNNENAAAQNNNPLAQAFSQLAQDLQSGNLSAAQQDFTSIQQYLQNQAQLQESQTAQSGTTQTHHHHHGGGGEESEISQLFDQLGQDLQSGNLTTAQQTFSTLQQLFQQFGQGNGTPAQASQPSTGSLSLNG
jgi:outer membrane protein assembly factor BamD (BamD/ComL family)